MSNVKTHNSTEKLTKDLTKQKKLKISNCGFILEKKFSIFATIDKVEVLPLPQVARRNVAQLGVFSQNHFLFDSLTMNRLIVLRRERRV